MSNSNPKPRGYFGDRIMTGLDAEYPAYEFKVHKGYITDLHSARLTELGPCPQHRMRFVNVRRAAGLEPELPVQNEAVPAVLDEVVLEESR